VRIIVHTSSLAAGAIVDGLTRVEVENILGDWMSGKTLGIPAPWGTMYLHPAHVVRLDVIGDDEAW